LMTYTDVEVVQQSAADLCCREMGSRWCYQQWQW
jgi:hypothetical protein